jgi:hypothetical protein
LDKNKRKYEDERYLDKIQFSFSEFQNGEIFYREFFQPSGTERDRDLKMLLS